VHVNVDVIDGGDLPGLRFPTGGGPSFSVVDATGQTTTATLHNLLGPAAPPPPVVVPNVSATPNTIDATTLGCNGKTFQVVIAGGTAPYNVAATGTFDTLGPKFVPVFTPAGGVMPAQGAISISGLVDGLGNAQNRNRYDFRVVDALATTDTFKITCTP